MAESSAKRTEKVAANVAAPPASALAESAERVELELVYKKTGEPVVSSPHETFESVAIVTGIHPSLRLEALKFTI